MGVGEFGLLLLLRGGLALALTLLVLEAESGSDEKIESWMEEVAVVEEVD